jgi:DNA-directed RNA polymerase sigma subunit (sigma70/sigma32)
MAVDLNRISALLREHLSPRQEKVVRLYFGLSCPKSFSATEIAREFRVSRQMISGIVGAAQRKLTPVGLTPSVLREAARLQGGTWRQPEPQRAADPFPVVRRRLCRDRSGT